MKIEFFPIGEKAPTLSFPPLPMKKTVPEWYKNLPTEVGPRTAVWLQQSKSNTNHTIKKCMPVLDYLTSGYTIRTQTEILLSAVHEGEDQVVFWHHASPDKETVMHHPHPQCPVKIQEENKTYLKFRCGFVVKTPPGYSCLFYQSPYFLERGIELFPAVVDTDVYDYEIFFPGFITSGFENITIPPGSPLVTVFPFKRETWEMSVGNPVPAKAEGEFFKHNNTWVSDVYRRFFQQEKNYL